jgi:SAM-dependent methyltransferase
VHTPLHIARVFAQRGRTSGLLYDASGGGGESSNLYQRLGFQVVCSAYAGKPKVDQGIRCVEGVDLNCRLPFDDETFDCAVLEEVIEHLENPAHVVREFNRVLKPGGWWVVTTPNALCLRSRVHFLLSGFVKGRRRPANYNAPPGDYTNLFIPSLPTFHYLLWSYGMRILGTGRAHTKWGSLALLPFLWPLVTLWTWFYTRVPRAYESREQREASRDLRKWMLSPNLLLDENAVLLVEKRRSAKGLYAPRLQSA